MSTASTFSQGETHGEQYYDWSVFVIRKRAPTRVTRDTYPCMICKTHGIRFFVKVKWIQVGREFIGVKADGVRIPRCEDYVRFGDPLGLLSGSAASDD